VVVHAVVVMITGVLAAVLLWSELRSAQVLVGGASDDSTKGMTPGGGQSCECDLRKGLLVAVTIACVLTAVGYFFLYIPLQSDGLVWLGRWLPWAVLSIAVTIPCSMAICCCCIPGPRHNSAAAEQPVAD